MGYYLMDSDRKWITREEIAEIHEAIADKAVGTGVYKTDEERWAAQATFSKHNKTARDIRATERLSQPIGRKAV